MKSRALGRKQAFRMVFGPERNRRGGYVRCPSCHRWQPGWHLNLQMVVDDELARRNCYWCQKKFDPEWLRNHTQKRISSYQRRVKRPRDYRIVSCPFCWRVVQVSRFPRHRCQPSDLVIQLQSQDPSHAREMAEIRRLVESLDPQSDDWPPTDPEIRHELMQRLNLPHRIALEPWDFAEIRAAWAHIVTSIEQFRERVSQGHRSTIFHVSREGGPHI